jgi:hypothetical protein
MLFVAIGRTKPCSRLYTQWGASAVLQKLREPPTTSNPSYSREHTQPGTNSVLYTLGLFYLINRTILRADRYCRCVIAMGTKVSKFRGLNGTDETREDGSDLPTLPNHGVPSAVQDNWIEWLNEAITASRAQPTEKIRRGGQGHVLGPFDYHGQVTTYQPPRLLLI